MKAYLKWFQLFLLIAAGLANHARAATVTIHITNFAFSPASPTIKTGDTITWVNDDFTTHTSTSGQNGTGDGKWNSPFLSTGQSFSRTFSTAGVFPYFCAIHTFMTGQITVQGAAPTPVVSITEPADNASFSAPGPVTISASATISAGSIAKVEFFDGATLVGSDDTAPYSIAPRLEAGAHTLTAKATALSGESSISAPITVTVASGGQVINDPIPAHIVKTNLTVELQTIASGMVSPVGLTFPDDGSNRLFVIDQAGLVYLVQDGVKQDAPILDVRSRLVALGVYDERGLLGIAAHPNFAQHPFIYTYTSEPNGPMADFMIMYPDATTNNHQSVIAEWRVNSENGTTIDPASRREILRIDKPQANHNGGNMRFGPDGFLYFSVGDGGNADDQGPGHSPGGNGQDLHKILGKISRIDVDARTAANGNYGVPTDNPFVGQPVVNEIFAFGFRNPYSFSFDRETGDLYVADVGQNKVEELDVVTKGGNFGWPVKEGTFYFDQNGDGAGVVVTAPTMQVPPNLVDPVAEYDHDEGLAIVGGYVYRGSAIPALKGHYICADWGNFSTPTGRLLVRDGNYFDELTLGADDRKLGLWVKGFGQDASGELYLFGSTTLGPNTGSTGVMLKFVPLPNNLKFTTFSASGGNIILNWSGGTGPFEVQFSPSLDNPHWDSATTTAEHTATVQATGETGYFRLLDKSSTP